VAAAAQLPEPSADTLLGAAREAFVQGLQLSSLIGAVGLAGTAVLVAFLLRSMPTTVEGDEHTKPSASEPSLDAAQAT
jgi:DHA2 family multidrug resistance protein-like MFS transporter